MAPTRVRLFTQFLSQETATAKATVFDCGPACLLMLIKTVNPNDTSTVDQISVKVEGGVAIIDKFRGTSLAQLRAVAAKPGINLTFTSHSAGRGGMIASDIKKAQEFIENSIADRRPVIALVNYKKLPEGNKGFPGFDVGHFIVIHGYDQGLYYYDDPFHPVNTGRGADLEISKADLFRAMQGGETIEFRFKNSFQMDRLQSNRVDFSPLMNAPDGASTASRGIGLTVSVPAISGTVTAAGAPLADAVVCLRSTYPHLILTEGAVMALAPGEAIWDHPVTGYAGDALDAYAAGWVDPSIAYDTFVRGLTENNGQLAANGFQMQADQLYTFPRPYQALLWSQQMRGAELLALHKGHGAADEDGDAVLKAIWQQRVSRPGLDLGYDAFVQQFQSNNEVAAGADLDPEGVYRLPEIVMGTWLTAWDRTTTGIEGTLDEVYNREIAPRFPEMRRADFHAQARQHNASLDADAGRFYRSKRYTLPTRTAQTLSYIAAVTAADGTYSLPFDLVGDYTLEVRALGYVRREIALSLTKNSTCDVTLTRADDAAPQAGDDTQGKALGAALDDAGDFWVQRQGNHFVLKNRQGVSREFRFVGVNVAGQLYWDEVFPGDGTPRFPGSDNEVQEQVNVLRNQMQGRVIRVFLARDSYDDTTTNDRKRMWSRLRGLLEKLNAADLYAIVAFTDVHSDRGHVLKSDLNAGAYKFKPRPQDPDMLRPDWYKTGFLDHYKPFVEATVTHFATDPAAKKVAHRIMAWELGNEVRAIPTASGVSPMEARTLTNTFIKTMARTIRNIEQKLMPGGPFHMIAVGAINSQNLLPAANITQIQNLYQTTPQLDFLTAHTYPDRGAEEAGNGVEEIPIAESVGMPFVMEEFSYNRDTNRPQRIKQDGEAWFKAGADGILYWGFLTRPDNNDGGDHNGLWKSHADFDNALQALRDMPHT